MSLVGESDSHVDENYGPCGRRDPEFEQATLDPSQTA